MSSSSSSSSSSSKSSSKSSMTFHVMGDSSSSSSSSSATTIVSFPQGIPWDLDEMKISVREKESKKSRKRKVVATLNGIEYTSGHGSSESQKKDASRYALGVIDEKTGKVEVFPVDHPHVLRPQVRMANSERTRESSFMSNYDRKQSLTETFGSKKKQKAQRAVASNIISTENISGVDVIETVMSGLTDSNGDSGAKGDLDAAEKALEAHRQQYLPAYDLSATETKHCYPIDKVIPPQVMESLEEMYDSITQDLPDERSVAEHWEAEFSPETLGGFRTTSSLFAENVRGSFSKIMDSDSTKKQKKYEKKIRNKVTLLLYLRILLDFYLKLAIGHNNAISKDDFIEAYKTQSSNPVALSRHFQDSFATYRKMNGKPMIVSTKQLMDKLLMQILVVALSATSDYKCNLSLMAEDLKMNVQKLSATSRELGCSNEKKQSYSIAVLTAPLKFPSRKMGAAKKK